MKKEGQTGKRMGGGFSPLGQAVLPPLRLGFLFLMIHKF
jgi:hypothetical protein